MKKVLIAISYFGLACTILPSILVLKGVLTLQNHFWLMTIGMLLWFSTAPFWMKSTSLEDAEDE